MRIRATVDFVVGDTTGELNHDIAADADAKKFVSELCNVMNVQCAESDKIAFRMECQDAEIYNRYEEPQKIEAKEVLDLLRMLMTSDTHDESED